MGVFKTSFELVKGEFPVDFDKASLAASIKAFYKDSRMENVEEQGFIDETAQKMSAAVYRDYGIDLWVVKLKGGSCGGYLLASFVLAVDNKLTYWISQAYIAPKYRGTELKNMCWEKIRDYAKSNFCRHIVVVSSRGSDGYCRFLGKGWHPYATLLKEDLEEK